MPGMHGNGSGRLLGDEWDAQGKQRGNEHTETFESLHWALLYLSG
jgi:hypothetical protein